MNGKETYIFAGGGTGGHLYPAVAIARRIEQLRPHCEIHFVGALRGIENRVVPELGFPLHRIAVRGVERRLTPRNLLVPFALLWSLLQCAVILLKIRPAAVIGTGGYVSGPVLFMASLFGFATVIQEQNSFPGATTRLLAKFVRRVHLSFEESKKYFKKQEKLFVTGNPVRQFDLAKDKRKARQKFGLAGDAPTLLVTGGSQGARAVNQALLGCIEQLMSETSLQIIWSAGKYDAQKVKESASRFGDKIWVSDFISDMDDAYAAADFALTRAGALTLAELTLFGLPSILIPYPYAAANHQETNAKALQQNGAAIVILEKKLSPELLATTIKDLLLHPDKRSAMGEAAGRAAFPSATDDIVHSIIDIAKIEGKGEHHESKS